MTTRKQPLMQIGWSEWISLPDLGVDWIKAKLDTGARTSALHAYDMEEFERDDDEWVRFVIHPMQRESRTTVHTEARVLQWRGVRSSNGKVENRPVIETQLHFFGKAWPIELTLTNRDQMGFRMLIGRQAMRGRLLIDASESFTGPRPPNAVREANLAKKPARRRNKRATS